MDPPLWWTGTPTLFGHREAHHPGPPPAPLLVTAGQGSDGLIMVNLESLGTLIVGGDPSGSEGVIRALSLELATSLWNGWFDLVVVGFGPSWNGSTE